MNLKLIYEQFDLICSAHLPCIVGGVGEGVTVMSI